MFIRKIAIENFIPYYGKITVDFPQIKGKNVYVVEGDNGYGKTSFLKAVKWAFFGEAGLKTDETYLNSTAKAEGKDKMCVSISFLENGNHYDLTREFESDRGECITFGERREQLKDEVAQTRITEIFPEHISRFFIFEGEMIRELAEAQGQDRAKKNIELLLGLEALQNAVDDLGTLRSKILEELKLLKTRNQEFEQVRRQHKNLQTQYEEDKKELDERRQELEATQAAVDQMEKELKRFEDMSKLVEEKEALKDARKKLREEQDQLVEERKKIVGNFHLSLIQRDLEKAKDQLEKELSRAKNATTSFYENLVRRRLLEDSLKKNSCEICGHTPIDEEWITRSIEAVRKNTTPATEASDPSKIQEELNLVRNCLVKGKETTESLRVVLKEYDSKEREIKAKSDRIEEITGEFKAFNPEEMKATNEAYRKGLERIGVLKGEISSRQDSLEETEEERDKKWRELTRFGDIGEKVGRTMDQLNVIKSAKGAFDQLLRRCVELNRKRILEAANEFFKRLTNKPDEYDRFEFASEQTYAFQLVEKDGGRPNMDMISDGEKEIVAISFVLGLSKYSRIKAPLIMDGVNSRLD